MAANVDIITLDNFEAKMPRWDPQAPNHLHALVDMGSNGIRFSITDLAPPRARLLRCVYRERTAISLFDALNAGDASGASGASELIFPAKTVELVAQTVARFRTIALDHGVPLEQISVFATEAMRRAANAGTMLDAIAAAAPGLAVHVLAPEVETLFGSMGARSGFVDVRGLFLDLGGGSVQMTYMDSSTREDLPGYEVVAAQTGQSLPFGAARLIRMLDGGSGGASAKAAKADLHAGMLAAFGKLCARFPELARAARADKKDRDAPGVDVYLCGGGFRGYGSMLMHNDPVQPYPIPLIGSYTVTGDYFAETKKMRKVNANYDGKIFGMSKRRREQFPAIATVVEALVDTVPNIGTVTFCAGGNREGALMMRLPRVVREANPLFIPAAQPQPPLPLGASAPDPDTIQAVVDALQSAVPHNAPRDHMLPAAVLAPLLAARMWERSGEDAAANAALALHGAADREPSGPGLNHRARASLALSLWARWGGGVAPVDAPRLAGLRALLGGPAAEATFWAEYVGACAAVLGLVFPVWPRMPVTVRKSIKFEAIKYALGKKEEIQVKVLVSSEARAGLDLQDLRDCFKVVGKQHKKEGGRVIEVEVLEFPSS